MIERTRDAALVNELVGRDFPGVDFSEILAEPLHVCLIEGESGAIFMWRGPGIYELHVFFAVRGRKALDLGRRMLREMKDARLFWALIPVSDRKTIMFTRLMGWKSQGVLETRNGPNELFVENVECPQQ